jgi:hypothetical protein
VLNLDSSALAIHHFVVYTVRLGNVNDLCLMRRRIKAFGLGGRKAKKAGQASESRPKQTCLSGCCCWTEVLARQTLLLLLDTRLRVAGELMCQKTKS